MLPLIIIGIILIVLIVTFIRSLIDEKGMGTIGRFMVGMPLSKDHKTNATHFKRGDNILHYTGRAGKWAHRSHIERAAIRWIVVIFLASVIFGLIMNIDLTGIGLGLFLIGSIAIYHRRLESKWMNRAHQRHSMNPLSEAIAVQLGITPAIARDSIVIRSDYAKTKGLEEIGRLVLPDWWQATEMQKTQFETLLNSRLPVELELKWHTTTHPMTVTILRAPIAPPSVPFITKKDLMESLSDDKFLLGTDGRNVDHYWDLNAEDCHFGCQAPSRRGKTRLLLLLASQVLHHGGEVFIIDPKRVGVDEALAGIDNVTIWNNPKDIEASWKIIHHVKEIVDSRIDEYEADRTTQFTRKVLFIDELSFYSNMSKRHWDKTKPKKAPAQPPLWDDLAELIYLAGFVKVNVVIFGQRIDQKNTYGLLESMGTRMAAGWTRQSYMRFIGIPPIPSAPKPRGRFLLYTGDETRIIQSVYMVDQEVRDFARNKHLVKPTLDDVIEINGGAILPRKAPDDIIGSYDNA
jgi:hypothetical protein